MSLENPIITLKNGFHLAILLTLAQTAFAQLPVREIAVRGLPDIAAASYDALGPVIRYNPDVVRSLDADLVAFFRAHEYGHIYLRHFQRDGAPKDLLTEIQFRDEFEREADCFAAELLARRRPRAVEAAITFFQDVQGSSQPDWFHPTGYNRAAAIRSCTAGRGQRDRITKASEQFAPWSDVDSDAGAREDIKYEFDLEHGVQWNTNGRPAVVRLQLKYVNQGDREIACEILVACGTIPRAAERGDNTEWIPFDVRKVAFHLPPGGTYTVRETLEYQTDRLPSTMPKVRYPHPQLGEDQQLDLMRAHYVGNARPPSSANGQFCTQFTRIVEARASNFQTILKPGTEEKDDEQYRTWKSTVVLPGASETEISESKRKRQFDCVLFASPDAESCWQRYTNTQKAIRNCLGQSWDIHESEDDTYYFQKSDPDEAFVIDLHCSTHTRTGNVSLTVYATR